eukprot:TRINITY_DN46229_c0_g1_i1.p1 TRINITY_DN46229_c0_g1~~TRINITY_DN46229_c0_g1_i1.p1  ORF type:complete len:715 (+),score=32.18 TRINITY_DN46229_c0_g1_i1:33-2177(+)
MFDAGLRCEYAKVRLRRLASFALIIQTFFNEGADIEGDDLDFVGTRFEFNAPSGKIIGRLHRSKTQPRLVALTTTHWMGCRSNFYKLMMRVLPYVKLLFKEQWGYIGLVGVHGTSAFIGADSVWESHGLESPRKRFEISANIPMACPGPTLADLYGHVKGTPCRTLLENDEVQLVRVFPGWPTPEDFAECTDFVVAPGDEAKPWSHDSCCTGPLQAQMILWRHVFVRDPNVINELSPDSVMNLDFRAPGVDRLFGYVRRAFRVGSTCVFTYMALITELLSLSDVSAADSVTVPWDKLERSLYRCDVFHGYKFVEYSFDIAAFLSRHDVPEELWKDRIPAGNLVVRFCAPAVATVEGAHSSAADAGCTNYEISWALVPLVVDSHIGGNFFLEAIDNHLGELRDSLGEAEPFVRPIAVPREYNAEAVHDVVGAHWKHHTELRMIYRTEASRMAAASASSEEPTNVAICILGMARTIHRREVYESVRVNVSGSLGARARVSYFHFWQTDPGRLAADFLHVLTALPPAVECTSCIAPPPPVRNLSCAAPGCAHQISDFEQCLDAVEAMEQGQSTKFDWIIRLRTDTRFDGPLGPISRFDPEYIHVPFKERPFGVLRNMVYHDTLAVVPRKHASKYFRVRREPRLCERALRRTQTHMCRPAFGSADWSLQCECLLDARILRLNLPISNVPLPFIHEKVRDDRFMAWTVWKTSKSKNGDR